MKNQAFALALQKESEVFMKKIISCLLCLVLGVSCCAPAFATNIQDTDVVSPVISIDGEGARVVSVEYILDSSDDTQIPEEVQTAFLQATQEDEANTAVPYGLGIPKASNKHDLSQSAYHFMVDTTYNVIYSNYVFTGHGGAVTMNIQDASETPGAKEFLVKVFVRGWLGTGTLVYQLAINRNSSARFTVRGLDSDDLVYFTVSPEGQGRLYLPNGLNYICKSG